MADDEWTGPTEERMAIAEVAAHTEPELLAAIDHQDHATRVVYADWLEEHGDLVRAELVRLQDRLVELPAGPERDEVFNRCFELGARTDMAWRVLVARPPIENCDHAQCPREWGSLAPADRTDVRICMTCNLRVFYCANSYDESLRRDEGARVVIDVAYPRPYRQLPGDGYAPRWPRR